MDLSNFSETFRRKHDILQATTRNAPQRESNMIAASVIASALLMLAETLVEIEISRQKNQLASSAL